MPCIVPRTEGCGEQLLSRMMEVGRVKVRAETCKKSVMMIQNQTQGPLAWPGGGIVEGAREI